MADASSSDLLKARELGSLSTEVKLAVERIAREINVVKSSIGGGDLEGRVSALESAIADIVMNEKLLSNAVAKSGGQVPPFGATIAIAGVPRGAVVTWTVDGSTSTGASLSTYLGATVSYVVTCAGYRKITGSKRLLADETITVSMQEAVAEDVVLSGDFADPTGQLVNFVDGSNFVVSGTAIVNGSKSYNVDSGTSYGYIKVTTKESCTLTINANVSSENNYDFGVVYVGTKIYKPTQSQAKNKTTDGSGSYLMSISSVVAAKDYTMTLQANSTYYLNFFYVKDGSGNSNGDRVYFNKIAYKAIIE